MTFYRYDDGYSYDSTTLSLTRYFLVRETECGYWVRHEYANQNDKNKFVLKGSNGKRLCYPDKAGALNSYLKRKQRQISILNSRLHFSQKMEKIAKEMNSPIDTNPAGATP